jgi:hypothetical protein
MVSSLCQVTTVSQLRYAAVQLQMFPMTLKTRSTEAFDTGIDGRPIRVVRVGASWAHFPPWKNDTIFLQCHSEFIETEHSMHACAG